MAKAVYMMVFVENSDESPIDVVSEWLASLPAEYTGMNLGIERMILSEVPLDRGDAETYSPVEEYANDLHN